MITNDKILTLSEVSNILKMSKPTIYRKVKSGEIPARKIGRGWRFLLSDMMGLVKPNNTRTTLSHEPRTPLDIETINQLCKRHYIALCYLFGSFAERTEGRGSDIDMGIVFLPNIDLDKSHALFTRVRDDFSEKTRPRELDLIFLQKTGPLIQEQAILGECVYSISDFFKTRYEDNISREAMDFRFFQKRFDEEMIEEIKKGGFFAA